MSTTTNLSQTLDGVNPIDTLGTPRDWDVVQAGPNAGFLGYLSIRDNTADDILLTDTSITGTNWQIVTLRFSAAFDNTATVRDLDDQAGRRIKYLDLGLNSDVDLISTRVDYMFGGDGLLHDVKLGSAFTRMVALYAEQNNIETGSGYVRSIEIGGTADIVVRMGDVGFIHTEAGDDMVRSFGGRISYLETGDGDDQVTIGAGGAGLLDLGQGDNSLTTKSGWVRGASFHNGDNQITIGAGGVGMLSFSTDSLTFTMQTITAIGWIESVVAYNNTTVSLGYGDQGGGTARFTYGDDSVTIGAGGVASVMTRGGDDQVTLGTGVLEHVNLGQGDDRLLMADGPTWGETTAIGGNGVDTIDFSAYGNEVTFSLNLSGAWQNPGAPNGDLELDGLGYIQASGFENIVGSRQSDLLIGNGRDNWLSGNKGADILKGGAGVDILEGGRGRDRMFAGNDADQDIFRFNEVNETFKGANKDRLFNFESGEDLIDLSNIDANTSIGGDQAFAFSGASAAAHSVWYKVKGPNVLLNADIDGDAKTDFVVWVGGVAALTAGDFDL